MGVSSYSRITRSNIFFNFLNFILWKQLKNYLNGIDLECLFKYMPVGITPESSSNNLSNSGPLGYRAGYHQINFVNALKQIFGESDALDVMLIYGKYVEKV